MVCPMDNASQQSAQAPVQPHEESPRYETPSVKKIGSMSVNTRPAKSVPPQVRCVMVCPMDNASQQSAQAPVQPHEESPRYETPAVKKIGSMSVNTKVKSIPG